MEVNLKITASHLVRLYLWQKLEEYMGDTWKKIVNTGGLPVIPIVIAQEQPELQDSGRPYMVYTYDILNTGDLYHLQQEAMAMTLYSQDGGTIASTMKLMVMLLNGYDHSADELNTWLWSSSGLEAMISNAETLEAARHFEFRELHVPGVTGADPAPGEARRMDSTITINMKYTEDDMDYHGRRIFGV